MIVQTYAILKPLTTIDFSPICEQRIAMPSSRLFINGRALVLIISIIYLENQVLLML